MSRCRCHGDAAPGRRIPTPAVSAAAPAPRTSDTRCEKAQPPCHCGDHELEELRNRFIHYTAITSDNPLVQTYLPTWCLSSGGRRFEFRAFLRNFRNHFLRNHLLRGEGEQREGTYVLRHNVLLKVAGPHLALVVSGHRSHFGRPVPNRGTYSIKKD